MEERKEIVPDISLNLPDDPGEKRNIIIDVVKKIYEYDNDNQLSVILYGNITEIKELFPDIVLDDKEYLNYITGTVSIDKYDIYVAGVRFNLGLSIYCVPKNDTGFKYYHYNYTTYIEKSSDKMPRLPNIIAVPNYTEEMKGDIDADS